MDKYYKSEHKGRTIDAAISYILNKLPAALANKVDKISGKDLSTNDYTDDDKQKVVHLPDDTTAELEKKANADNVLSKDNTTEFTPSDDYQPATKKYVDENKAETYIFSDQFATDGQYVVLDGAREDTQIDLTELFEGKAHEVTTPTDEDAYLTYKGVTDTPMLSNTAVTRIISSKSGKVISLPKGVNYTEGMDISAYDSVDIISLHSGEYVDKDGKVYTYKNVNAVASAATDAPQSAMRRSTANAALTEPVDGLVPITLKYRDVSCNQIYSVKNLWGERTDTNGSTYYYFRTDGYGLEQFDGSKWSYLTSFVYPANDTETAFCFATFPDDNGQPVSFKAVDYSTLLTTTEDNVCAMQYISTANGVAFYIKPKSSYGYNVSSGGVLQVGETAVNNAWLVIKRREVAYEKTVPNKIKTYAGGKLIFIPDENISEYASVPDLRLNTVHYAMEQGARYINLELGEAYPGQSGVVGYKITAGLSEGVGTNTLINDIISTLRTAPFPAVIGTKGTLKTSGGASIVTEELFGYGNIFDEMSEECLTRKFSDPVILLGEWLQSVTQIGTANGSIWEFHIPVSAVDYLPEVCPADSPASILNPAFGVKSEADIRAMTTFAYNTYAISFTYTEGAEYITVLLAQNYLYGGNLTTCRKAVDASKLPIKYLLQDYRYKYNVDKLYIENGESINFELDEGKAGYKSIELRVPMNNRAAVDMLKPITGNINDLNYKIENIEAVSSIAIGKGDGKTDDTAALQDAINSAKNSADTMNSVIIPAGHYIISSPLFINNDNTVIRGEGEVIIECADVNYRLPLIVVKANDVTIDNLILKIGYEADDPQYTAGYNKNTDTDPDISTNPQQGLHCGIWLDTANTYNHLTAGEALDEYKGYYRNYVKNCNIIGGYRYSVKKLERSYGIYVPDSGYLYFARLDGINLYNLYCGIRLGDRASSCYMDFHFDADINRRGGASDTNCGGCRFGLISYARYSNINCYGQMVGGNIMPPIYYDDDGNELLMSTSTAVRKQLTDITTGELTDVYTDNGWQDGIMTYPTLSETGIVIHGKNNYIYAMIYDVQRASGGLVFMGIDSEYNEVYLPSGMHNDLYGSNETTYIGETYNRTVTVDNTDYYDVVRYNVHYLTFTDLGVRNFRSEKNIENRSFPFIGDRGVWARDDAGKLSRTFAVPMGMQDNFLSFVDKWGTVSVTQGDNSISQFNTLDKLGNAITVTGIGSVFDTNSEFYSGFDTGITLGTPTADNPIVIDIDFGGQYPSITSGFILFNRYIAKSLSISLIGIDGLEKLESIITDNHNAMVYYRPFNISNSSYLSASTCKGMRIKIYEGLVWTDADEDGIINPTGQVGISYIYMANTNAGGRSYLPRGGGEIYGDITAKMGDATHKLSEKVDKEDGKGLSDAASVDVNHCASSSLFSGIVEWENIRIEKQNGTQYNVSFYSTDQTEALLDKKVDKDTTGMRGLSNAKTVALSDSISTPSQLKVTEQGGSEFVANFYNAELTDKMLAKLREQSVPHTAVSDYPVTLTDALAGESLRGIKVYGGCGKNLFDKDNAAYLIGYFTKNVTDITTHANARTIYIPCKPNTTYTISRNTSYSNFHFGYTTTLPANGVAVSGAISAASTSITSLTLTTGANAKYLVSYIYNGYSEEGTENAWNTIIGGIQIEQGSTATAWKEYKEVGDGGKNLLPYPYYHASRTTNGITYTDNGDGTITASGTATGTAYHYAARITTENMLCEGGKTYTFSWGGVGSSSTYYGFVRVDDAVKTATATGSVTFTPSTSQYIDVGFLIISGVTVDNLVIKPQIEKGSTATDYEPPCKNLFDKNSDFDAVRQNYPPTITRENNTVVVSAGGGATTKMGAWIIPTNGKTKFAISADSVAFEGSPTALIREADSFPEYITTVSTFGNAVDTITAQEGFTKTVNVSSAYIAIVMQAAGEQKITFDNLRVTAPTYKIPVRVYGKNLFDSEQLLKASGWTCEDGVYSGTVSTLFKAFGIETEKGYDIPLRGKKLAISFEAKNSDKTTVTTYFQVHYTDGAKQNIGAINSTEWKKYSGVTNAGNISKIIAGYSNDDTVYFRNIQIEAASAVTDYEPYSEQAQTATLTSPLSGGEYIDLLGKKRYAANGTATDITVTGELKTIESGSITIDCTTGVQPPRIEAEYWQDINKVVGNLTSAILANGGNA